MLSRRAVSAAIIALLPACSAFRINPEDYAGICADLGVTPGTDSFEHCIEQQRLQHQAELTRIRQLRESGRQGSRL